MLWGADDMGAINMIGERYGRLVVVAKAPSDKYWNSRWRCQCDCGATKETLRMNLIKGLTQSCGCLHKDIMREEGKKTATHGMALSRTYKTWIAMVRRCTKPTDQAWKKYGQLGIMVCDRWINSFENFYADMGERPHKTSIDRINPFKGYSPDNCRWADANTQAKNTQLNYLKEHGLCSVLTANQ